MLERVVREMLNEIDAGVARQLIKQAAAEMIASKVCSAMVITRIL